MGHAPQELNAMSVISVDNNIQALSPSDSWTSGDTNSVSIASVIVVNLDSVTCLDAFVSMRGAVFCTQPASKACATQINDQNVYTYVSELDTDYIQPT